jgi:hypothetical protein
MNSTSLYKNVMYPFAYMKGTHIDPTLFKIDPHAIETRF